MDTDRNLRFGVLALEKALINPNQFAEACAVWNSRRDQPLGDILLERGVMAAEDRHRLDALVDDAATVDAAADSQGTTDEATADYVSGHVERRHAARAGMRYRILRAHAKGGLGEVSIAEDLELHREVALKEIKKRFADDLGRRNRFVLEAKITGRLEHPGIVPVYGLGTYPDGRPYYAMKLIRGDNLDTVISRFHSTADGRSGQYDSLAFRGLLRRFIDTCNAVAYAHSRGVVHRDLKPGNVMLGQFGETLVVDWGLAKSTAMAPTESGEPSHPPQPGGANAFAETVAGVAIGTVAFMSPEQAAGNLAQVGPPSDVYSLGATLFKLLTGALSVVSPLPPGDPGTMADVLARVQRGDVRSPESVRPHVPQVLAAICKKAMALRPADRYASALALAADVEHWLADEPVCAFTEPLLARAARWARKHRTLVTGIVVALAGAVALLGVSLVLVEQNRRHIAHEKDETERQRVAAVTARDYGRETIDYVFSEETLDALKRQRDLTPRQKTFLTNMLRYYRELVTEEPQGEAGRELLARAYYRLGYGLNILGRKEEALAAFSQAKILCEGLATEFPSRSDYRQEHAKCLTNFGVLLNDLGKRGEAEAAYRRALQIEQELSAESPNDPAYRQAQALTQNNYGLLLEALGRREEAERAYRQALTLRTELASAFPAMPQYRQDLATSHLCLGILLNELGQGVRAEAEHRHAVAIQQKLVAEFPSELAYRQDLALSYANLATLLRTIGQEREAEPIFGQALAIREQVASEYPTVPHYRFELSAGYHNLGSLLTDLGKNVAAEEAYRKALGIREKLVADFPRVPDYRHDHAATLNGLGILLANQEKSEASEQAFQQALVIREKLAADFPDVPSYRLEVAGGYNNLGIQWVKLGMNDKAQAAFRKALDIQAHVVADFPEVPEHSLVLSAGYCNFGNLLLQKGQAQAALPWFVQAISTLESVLARQPRHVTARQFLSNSHWGQARAFDDLGQHVEAARAWEKALEFDDGAEAKGFRSRLALSRLRGGLGQDLAWPLVWGWPRF